MSQSYAEDLERIRQMTLDPDIGGSTYHPHTATIMPVHFPPNPAEPDIWVVGGAPNKKTGRRFPTDSKVSPQQFTTDAIDANVLRAHIASIRQGDPSIAAGTWHITDPEHPRHGQVDLDVSDLFPSRDEALRAAKGRGEEEVFGNQGAELAKTHHSPTHPKYRKKRTRKRLRNQAAKDND